MTTLVWQSEGHLDEPRDQQVDLGGPYWAEVGPDARQRPDGWSWTVLDFDLDNAEVASGFADTETAAKAAVAAWDFRWRFAFLIAVFNAFGFITRFANGEVQQ